MVQASFEILWTGMESLSSELEHQQQDRNPVEILLNQGPVWAAQMQDSFFPMALPLNQLSSSLMVSQDLDSL